MDRNKNVLLIIFFAAMGLRLWFLFQLQSDPVFRMPVNDPKEFNFWAFQISEGKLLWNQVTNHAPLYPYFIAGIYKIFGFHVNAVALIQSILGAVSACLMYLLMLRLANPVAALTCAGLMSVYWLFIYTQVHLLSESLAMFLNIALIYCLTFAKDSGWKFLFGGVLLGLSLICRPDILPFAAIVLWWILKHSKDPGRGWTFYGIFMAGALMVVVPVLVRNHQISGEWVLRSQVGVNIFMGNDPDHLGTNIFVERGRSFDKLISMPYREMDPDHELTENEINSFYIRQTLKNIQEHPGKWVFLLLGKAFSVLTGREFLRSEDVYFRDLYVRYTPLMICSTQLIFILALSGLFLSWRDRKKLLLIHAVLLSTLGAFVFPTRTRYLVPVIPFMMVFSSLAVSYLYEAIKKGHAFDRIKIYAIVLFLTLLALINPLGLREPNASETYFATASNLQYLKQTDLSVRYFQKALALNPRNSTAMHEFGMLYLSIGDYGKALECFDRAKRIDPQYAYWEQLYYDRTRAMIDQGQSSNSNDRFFRLEKEGNPVVERYLKYFRYPD